MADDKSKSTASKPTKVEDTNAGAAANRASTEPVKAADLTRTENSDDKAQKAVAEQSEGVEPSGGPEEVGAGEVYYGQRQRLRHSGKTSEEVNAIEDKQRAKGTLYTDS